MEESDSGQQQKRCPCGFFGSAQTSGLCSKCYKATVQPDKSQEQMEAKAEIMRNKEHSRVPQYSSHDTLSAASSSSFYHGNITSSASAASGTDSLYCGNITTSSAAATGLDSLNKHDPDANNVTKQTGDKLVVSNIDKLSSVNVKDKNTNDNSADLTTSKLSDNSDIQNKVSDSTEDNNNSDVNIAKENNTSNEENIAKGSNHDSDIITASSDKNKLLVTDGGQEKRGVKRDSSVLDEQPSTPEKGSGAKSKKRCGVCRCKLELAQRAIGRCKCDSVYCSLHRLPEQHDCKFDHKEDGRREAREKMVKPTRHLGTSFKRLDSDS